MRLLTRYVLGEVLRVFLVTLVCLSLLLMLLLVAKEAVVQGLSLVHVLRLVPYILPNALLFAVPGTILFAVSSVYGRMASGGEVVAIKSLGISPLVIVWPAFALAAAASLLTVWLNDVATSWGYRGAQRVVLDAVEDISYGILRAQRSYSTPQFSVVVERVDGHKLIHPAFSFRSTADSPEVTITATEAELRSNPGSGVLTISFRDGTIEFAGTTSYFPGTIEREISLDGADRQDASHESPSHLALRFLPQRTAEQRLAIQRSGETLAAQAAYQMLTGDFQRLGSAAWADDVRGLQNQRNELSRLETEPPRRWANGFSCLCFALVGAPMAIRLKNSDVLTSFFACFLPILIFYYPLLMFGVDRAKAGAVPPNTVWLANAVLALWAAWLLRKVMRY
jgi:lipopolysaccharide export system permease protein